MPAPGLARVQRVTGTVECADLQAVVRHLCPELASRSLALQHPCEIDIRRARPIAAGELQHIEFKPRGGRQQRFEREVGQAVGDHADLHAVSLPKWRYTS